jgi:hypothetical protein
MPCQTCQPVSKNHGSRQARMQHIVGHQVQSGVPMTTDRPNVSLACSSKYQSEPHGLKKTQHSLYVVVSVVDHLV